MQGRLQGKRLHGAVLPRQRARARHRGLQLPARRRRRHEHRRRLRDQLVGARLRRHGVRARPATRSGCCRTCRPRRWCSATWPGSTTTRRCVQSPRTILKTQVERAAEHGLRGAGRHRARVHRLQRHLRGGLVARLPRPHPAQPVQRRLLASSAPRRVEPLLRDIRNRMYAAGHERRVRQGRVQPRPARDRLPVRRGAGHRRQPLGLQDGAKEIAAAARQGADVHGEVRRARGQLVPHPPVPARRRRRRSSSGRGRRRRTAALRPVRRRRAGHDARLHAALRAEHQLLQAVRRRVVRADGDRLGARQPHLRPPPGRSRRRGCGWRTGCPAAT